MTTQSSPATKCPRCAAPASGPFCSACGATVAAASCASCGTSLSSGARFCHRCGAAADGGRAPAAATRGTGDPLPWAVAAIALVALIALVAGQQWRARQSSAPDPQTASGTPGGGPAPNISQMTPREMTDRLFNRVMTLHEAGLNDSAAFIAKTMAIPAFDFHDSLDVDLRYHLGRIAEVSGEGALAKAQADSILRDNPNHLLGIILAANVARKRGDSTALRALNRRLLAAEKAELALGRGEYTDHKFDIDAALSAARGGSRQQ